VIERSLAAIGDSLTLDQLKLIVLMVLWNQQVPTSRLVAEDLFSAPHARLPKLTRLRAPARARSRAVRGLYFWRSTVEPLARLHLSSPAFRALWEKNSSSQRSRRSPPTFARALGWFRAQGRLLRSDEYLLSSRSAICLSSRFRTSTR